jgi:hypothetical protein
MLNYLLNSLSIAQLVWGKKTLAYKFHHLFLLLSFINPLDEQFVHLQIHPPSIITTPAPIPYPHLTPIINPNIPIASYTHLHPPPPYGIPNGPTFYQPSPTSTTTFQQPLATPYHPHHPQILPGLPPHAPIASHRTVNFTTTIPTNNYHQHTQRLSPTSTQTQDMNIQALQQRMMEQQKHQQTPISLQRQMNRLPTVDYTQ